MLKCPLFGICGGCKFDFTRDNYREEKLELLKELPKSDQYIWLESGIRRRAELSFLYNKIGFLEEKSKNIVEVKNCPILTTKLNETLEKLHKLKFTGAGSILITELDNGIDLSINSIIPVFDPEIKKEIEKTNIKRLVWNNKIIFEKEKLYISFEDKKIYYPPNSFLQPSKIGENTIRDIIKENIEEKKKTADLFCGLGTFTYSFNATGFDIKGNGKIRDLMKHPLKKFQLNEYDIVILDPPRIGAEAQVKELVKSNISKIIYISCNPKTFKRDLNILNNSYKLIKLYAIDQFIGSMHWEIVGIFSKIEVDNK